MRRTVKVEFIPRPRRPMTTPEKIWMRSLSPSTTFVCTRTESPTPKSTGCLRNCSDSILSNNAWFIKSRFHLLQQIRPPFLRPPPRLFRAPPGDLGMVAREQHFRHLPAPELRRPRIMRILQQFAAERFVLRTAIVAQHTGQQPRHRVDDHHRRQRAVGKHVIADRQLVVREVLPDPLVESFVAAAD